MVGASSYRATDGPCSERLRVASTFDHDDTKPAAKFAGIRRIFDAAEVNAVANDPDVRPHVGGEGVLDLTAVVHDPANFVLWADGGGFLVAKHEPGIYEAHSLFRKSARRHSIAAMRAAFAYMFERTDAVKIVTIVPDGNSAALAFAKLASFREVFRTAARTHYALSLVEWAVNRPELAEDGAAFHEVLQLAKIAAGSALPVHDDCEAHDRMVGAAIRMIRAGNAEKAVVQYNRWARMAGYAPISIVSLNPLTIDLLDAVAEVVNGDMEVVLCR